MKLVIFINILTIILIIFNTSVIVENKKNYDTYAYYGKAKVIEVHEEHSLIEYKDCKGVWRRQWIEGSHEPGTVVEVSIRYKVMK